VRWLILAVLALAGCKMPGSQTSAVAIAGLQTSGGFLQIQSTTGLTLTANYGTLMVRLTPKGAARVTSGGVSEALGPPGRVPGFTSLMVQAHSPTRLPEPRTVVLTAAQFDERGQSLVPVLTRIPAAEDLSVRVYLRDAEGKLMGSGERDGLSFKRGTNELDMEVVPNTVVPELIRSSDNINVADGVIVKGATLELKSGIVDALPGVSRVEIEVDGPAYAGGAEKALIATLDAPNLETYSWKPVNSSENYAPAKLVASTTQSPFNLTTRAIDPFGGVVATAKLPLQLVGTAFVSVDVDERSGKPARTPAPTPTPDPADALP
jgi:hypothetical protein